MIPGREAKVGRDAAEMVERAIGLVDDDKLTGYVRAIGERLAAHAGRNVEYRFYVADMKEPNAFALPGGHIYVSRGLLAITNSEDELAGVIGHEIGHVEGRHHMKSQARAVSFLPIGIAAAVVTFVASVIDPGLGEGVGGVVMLPTALVLSSYSRGQESDADRIGQQLVAKAGWDPAGLSSMLHTLGREETLRGGDPERVDFLASHPPSAERSRATQDRATTLTRADPDPIARTHADFLGRLDGMLIGLAGAEGALVDQRFLHPDLGFSLRYPDGWEVDNLPQVVAARGPDKETFAVLQIVGEGVDPLVAARQFRGEASVRMIEEPTALRIGGLRAARAMAQSRGRGAPVSIDATWIALKGKIYLISGIAKAERFNAARPALRSISDSFRPITPMERAEVTEARLRIESARKDDSLAAMAERSKSPWDAPTMAVANGIKADATLSGGALIKVPVPEPYPRP
jgi:predicted Zn-dependent protease